MAFKMNNPPFKHGTKFHETASKADKGSTVYGGHVAGEHDKSTHGHNTMGTAFDNPGDAPVAKNPDGSRARNPVRSDEYLAEKKALDKSSKAKVKASKKPSTDAVADPSTFKMKGAQFSGPKTGHVPSYKRGDNLKEHFLAKRAAKTEGKFEKYLDESGSVESPKGDRLAVRANKAAAAHQTYTDKRAVKAVAKNKKRQPGYEPPVKRSDLDVKGKAIWDNLHKKNKGKNKEAAQGATREDKRKENKQERKQNRINRRNK
jgi:hypothetical protein